MQPQERKVPVNTNDFNGDGKSDILWRDTSGNVAIWFMDGAQAQFASLGNVPLSWSIVGTGDFNGDGNSDILWRDDSGNMAIWFMGGAQAQFASLGNVPTVPGCAGADCGWVIAGTGDFNGDGKTDILWENDASGILGQALVAIWFMDGAQAQYAPVGTMSDLLNIWGTGDFNGDGNTDILWRNQGRPDCDQPQFNCSPGDVAIWFMNGAQAQSADLGNVPNSWSIVGTGDFNGDGNSDILWRDTSGNVAIWFMGGAQAQFASLGNVPLSWSIVGTGDFNGDGKSDILWGDTSGNVAIWFMNGAQAQYAGLGNVPTSWSIIGYNAIN